MFDGKYLEWNQKRIKLIIEKFGVDFIRGKKVLDLGCGHGDVGAAFYRLGADVTAVDIRDDHIKIAKKKHPGIKIVKADLDNGWPFDKQNFDIILDLGLICHLANFEKHLKEICENTTYLVLETSVCDSDNSDQVFIYSENKGVYDWSFNGTGCRPSPSAVEKVLKNCGMDFKRIDSNKINAGTYKYDWAAKNNNYHANEQRRFWFAEKNKLGRLGITRKTPSTIKNTHISAQSLPPLLPPPPPIVDQVKSYSSYIKINDIINNPDKLKVAVCISGYLRSFEQTFESLFLNLTSQFDCDFFIHTWDTIGAFDRGFDLRMAKVSVKDLEIRIKNIYNPKQFMIEPRRNFNVSNLVKQKSGGRDPQAVFSMYYSINQSNKLKIAYENTYGFKYNYVFRYRPDMLIQSKIIVDSNLNNNLLYIPTFGDFGGINDQFAFSSSKNMDIYCSLIDNIEGYIKEGQILNPEFLLKYHIDKNKIPVMRFGCNYILKRLDGTFQRNDILERRIGFIK